MHKERTHITQIDLDGTVSTTALPHQRARCNAQQDMVHLLGKQNVDDRARNFRIGCCCILVGLNDQEITALLAVEAHVLMSNMCSRVHDIP